MSNGPECKYYGFTVGTVSDSRLPNKSMSVRSPLLSQCQGTCTGGRQLKVTK